MRSARYMLLGLALLPVTLPIALVLRLVLEFQDRRRARREFRCRRCTATTPFRDYCAPCGGEIFRGIA